MHSSNNKLLYFHTLFGNELPKLSRVNCKDFELLARIVGLLQQSIVVAVVGECESVICER